MKTQSSNKFDITLLAVRITLGLVIAAHGAQKLLGWFGGYGFNGTMSFFTETIGVPSVVALLIILAESVGMLALVAGAFSRLLAVSLIAIMVGAIVTSHWNFGFFMNWSGAQGGEGFEFHILAAALAGVVAINGGGIYSVDHLIKKKFESYTEKRSSLA